MDQPGRPPPPAASIGMAALGIVLGIPVTIYTFFGAALLTSSVWVAVGVLALLLAGAILGLRRTRSGRVRGLLIGFLIGWSVVTVVGAGLCITVLPQLG